MRALKIIFSVVAALLALNLANYICYTCYYSFWWDMADPDAFDVLSTASLAFSLIYFISKILLSALIATGFFIWFAKSKPGMKVKAGAMMLAISALLAIVLVMLQMFGVTHYQYYWYYYIETANFGWIALNIVDFVGVILLMRSVRGKAFMKTMGIIGFSLTFTANFIWTLVQLDPAMDLWEFMMSEGFIWTVRVFDFIAGICCILFYALYASTFKVQPALVQGSEPIQSAEPTKLATHAAPAVPTTQQRLDELQRQIDELQRLKAQQEANNNPQSNE